MVLYTDGVTEAFNEDGEMFESQRLMQAHGYNTALLISTRGHLPRARRFADYYRISARLSACEG